ncbi:MAG: hypothetical protein WC763_01240 [Candidatus Paceibacterota bacterium]|jgi:hypothetical protein
MIITRTLSIIVKTPQELEKWLDEQSFEGKPLRLATNHDVPADQYHELISKGRGIIANFIPMSHGGGPRNPSLPLGFEPVAGKARLSLISIGTAVPLLFEVWGPLTEEQAVVLIGT